MNTFKNHSTESLTADVQQALDSALDTVINSGKVPGLSVAVIQDGPAVHSRFAGYADIQQHKPVTASTVFRIGSISKTFTAIGLMQFWEQGRFDLDAPVNDYLKTYRIQHPDPAAPPITFRHLLTHRSGLGMIRSFKVLFDVTTAGLGVKAGHSIPPLGAHYHGLLQTEVHAGAKWCYANDGFATLGQLVEDISGEPFADTMRAHVFDPLGMHHTDYLRNERVSDELAIGYSGKRGKFKPVRDMDIIVAGAGSIYSTTDDMIKYVAWLLSSAAQPASILKPETLRMMMTPQFQLDPHLPAMGLAFILERIGDHPAAWHNGGWPGFASVMWVVPEARLGLLVFGNAMTDKVFKIDRALLHTLLDVPNPVEQLAQTAHQPAPDVGAELVGYYAPAKGLLTNVQIWGAYGGGLEVELKQDRLRLKSLIGPLRKGAELIAQPDPLIFKYEEGDEVATVAFKRDASGQIDRLCAGTLELFRRPPSHSLRYRLQLAAGIGLLAVIVLLLAILLPRRK